MCPLGYNLLALRNIKNFSILQGWALLSTEESFAENRDLQRAAKSVCSVNTYAVKNASFG